jgi:transcriptional regulator with XRE-family HTH domain
MGFRDNLKAALQFSGISVVDLAGITGISKHSLDNYLNLREQIPSAEAAVKIARALGVTVEYLVLGSRREPEAIRSRSTNEVRELTQIVEKFDKSGQDFMLTMAKSLKKLQTPRRSGLHN